MRQANDLLSMLDSLVDVNKAYHQLGGDWLTPPPQVGTHHTRAAGACSCCMSACLHIWVAMHSAHSHAVTCSSIRYSIIFAFMLNAPAALEAS